MNLCAFQAENDDIGFAFYMVEQNPHWSPEARTCGTRKVCPNKHESSIDFLHSENSFTRNRNMKGIN